MSIDEEIRFVNRSVFPTVLTSLSDVGLSGRRSFLEIHHPDDFENTIAENEIDYQNYKMFSSTVDHSNLSRQISFFSSNTSLPNRRSMLTTTTIRRIKYFSIEFQIKPLAERGLLMYYGCLEPTSSTGFISLSLQGSVVEFRTLSSDQNVNIVRSVRMLAIGEWHKIKASQSGRRISLWIEGTASAALASTSDVFIRNDSHIFLGGVPDLSNLPDSSISGYPMPMRYVTSQFFYRTIKQISTVQRGCIRHLSVNGIRVVLNETNIFGENG